MEKLLETVVRELVDKPDSVQVTSLEGEQTQILEVRTDRSDIGKVIGVRGRTADALRTIVSCVGAKYNKRYIVHIIDEQRDKSR